MSGLSYGDGVGDSGVEVTQSSTTMQNEKREGNPTIGFAAYKGIKERKLSDYKKAGKYNICINCMKEKPEEHQFCPYCGFDGWNYTFPSYVLPPCTLLYDRYMVGKMLGAGGFGITYLARDQKLGRIVAVKEFFIQQSMFRDNTVALSVTASKATDSQKKVYQVNQKKFRDEAKILASLEHVPGIVRVYDFFEENDTAYMVMEYLSGMTLKCYVKQKGKLSIDDLVRKLNPIMDSLDQLHLQGIFHRDISPDNIMVAEDGTLTLFDFGGAKISEQNGESSIVLAKSGYSPIEQLQSGGELGPWTDIYSLAATIYYCITGVVPPESASRVDTTDSLKKPSEIGASLRRNQETVLLKALALRYRERYQTMPEFKTAVNTKRKSWIWKLITFIGLTGGIIAVCILKNPIGTIWNWYRENVNLRQGSDSKRDEETEYETPAIIIYPASEQEVESGTDAGADDVIDTGSNVETDADSDISEETNVSIQTNENTDADSDFSADVNNGSKRDATEIIADFNKGILSYGEAAAQLSGSNSKTEQLDHLKDLKQSKTAYQKGGEAAKNEKIQDALIWYGSVLKEDTNYEDAQVQIMDLKSSEVAACREEVDALLEEERYGEAIDRVDSAMQIVPDSEELSSLRMQCISDYSNYAISYSELLIAEEAHEEARKVLQEAYEITGDTELQEKIKEIDIVVVEENVEATLKADGSMLYGGHTYFIYNRHEWGINSYSEMELFCERKGGHLAVITSSDENRAIYEFIVSRGYKMAYFGYSDEDQEGNWQWVTGENSTYTNWSDGQPNNGANNKNKVEEDYAHFTGDGVWNDAPFGSNTSVFVCEWDYECGEEMDFLSNDTSEAYAVGDDSFYLDGTVVPANGYILPNSASSYLTESDVKKLTHKGIRYAINEIYAVNGYTFTQKQELKQYFGSQSWYGGGDTTDQSVIKSRMNRYEVYNVDLLVALEKTLWGGEYELD